MKYLKTLIFIIFSSSFIACNDNITLNAPKGLIVIFKADDLGEISPSWSRFFRIVLNDSICAGVGIISNNIKTKGSLEEIKRLSLIKQNNKFPVIEFWNHGFDHSKVKNKTEFDGTNFDYQMNHLQMAQKYFYNILQLTNHCFSAPFNRTDIVTDEVLKSFPEINIWLYYNKLENQTKPEWKDPKNEVISPNDQHIILNIDYLYFHGFPIDNIIENFNSDNKKSYIVIQIHPAMWNNDNFVDFEKLIHFYKQNHLATFMTPYQYYQFLHKKYNANDI
ncbi:MAG: polysaccharide deacetylase family protein [Paludibacter sp.]